MSTMDLLANLKSTFLSVSRRQQLSSHEWLIPLGRSNGLTFSVDKINKLIKKKISFFSFSISDGVCFEFQLEITKTYDMNYDKR